MSAYGPGKDSLRSFQSKCRAVSATRRKTLEEATAALHVDTNPPPPHAEDPLATTMTRSDPPVEQSSSFGISLASETAPTKISARTANSRRGLAKLKRTPAVSSPTRRIVGTPAEQQQDRFPPQCHVTTFRGISSRAAAAAEACISDPIDEVGTSARSSLRNPAGQPPSARPPVTVAGHGGTPFRVPSIRTALQDLAGIGDAAGHPSPVEQVLARRKRRRRANFGVSSALLLSASTEEVPLPSMPEPGPLVTPEDDEHSTTAFGVCDELESLDLSRISWDSSGSWKSKVAPGFRREPHGTVGRVDTVEGAIGVPQALNVDQCPSSKIDHDLDSNCTGNCDGFAACTSARSDHREGTPSGELREVALRQVGVGTASCGRMGCAQGGERWPRARAKQDKLGALEGCRGNNTGGLGDRCWNRVPQTEGRGKPNAAADMLPFDDDQDAPPSPLPSPPVPLSLTARRGTSTVRRRPPSRVSASDGTLLQPCQDDSRAWGASDSKHNSLCTEMASTFGMGNDAASATPRAAKNKAPGGEEPVSPPEDPFPESRGRGSIVGLRGDGGIEKGVVGQAPHTAGASSPQPRLGDRTRPPETVLLQDTAAPATDDVPPKVRLQREASIFSPASPSDTKPTPCDGYKASPTSSPSAQETLSTQCAGEQAGAQAKELHATTYAGIDMAVSLSSSTRVPHKASPPVDFNPPKQAQPSKTTAELTLQRWLRRAILRRKRSPGPEGGAARRTREQNEPKKVEQLQPAKSSTSTARHHRREAQMVPAVHAHAGASPVEKNPVGQQKEVSLLPAEAEPRRSIGVVPRYWEDDPIRDRSHVFVRESRVVASADRDAFGETPVPSSPAFARNDDVSHGHPMDEPSSGADKSATERRRPDSRQDDDTIQPPDPAAQEKTAGNDRAPEMPSSTVLFSVPAPRAASLSLELPSPVPDARREPSEPPSEREKSSSTLISPTGGGRNRHSRRVQGHDALSSFVSNHAMVARDMPCFSVEALGRRFAPADVGFKVGAGYGLTVQEARLRPSSGQGKGCSTSRSFRSPFVIDASDRKNCRPGAVVPAVAEIPVVASHGHQEGGKPSVLLARVFARQVNTNHNEDVGGNPLLDAWGVRNPLLTRSPGKISGASNRGGAPHG